MAQWAADSEGLTGDAPARFRQQRSVRQPEKQPANIGLNPRGYVVKGHSAMPSAHEERHPAQTGDQQAQRDRLLPTAANATCLVTSTSRSCVTCKAPVTRASSHPRRHALYGQPHRPQTRRADRGPGLRYRRLSSPYAAIASQRALSVETLSRPSDPAAADPGGREEAQLPHALPFMLLRYRGAGADPPRQHPRQTAVELG